MKSQLSTPERQLEECFRPTDQNAVEAIVETNHQNCGNGYIWHTTGGGKTLTTIKASTQSRAHPVLCTAPNAKSLNLPSARGMCFAVRIFCIGRTSPFSAS